MKKIVCALVPMLLLSGCSNEISGSYLDEKQPEQEASPFDKMWPTEFSKKDLSDAALEEVFLLYDENNMPESVRPLVMYEEETVPEGQGKCAEDAANRILFAFQDFLDEDFKQREHSVVLGTTSEWVVQKISETGAYLPDQEFVDGNGSQTYQEWLTSLLEYSSVFGVAEDSTVILATDMSTDCDWMGYFASHETFHLVHSSLDKRSLVDVRPGIDEKMAAWYYEGAAEFFSYSIQDYSGFKKYVSPSFLKKPGGLKAHEPLDAPVSLYIYGHFAIEYLVANVGVEPVMGVFKNIGNGDNFDVAFEKAIGMSLEDFYKLFDSINVSIH